MKKDLYDKWLEYAIVYFKWDRKYGPIWKHKIKKKLYKKLFKKEKEYQIPENTIITVCGILDSIDYLYDELGF